MKSNSETHGHSKNRVSTPTYESWKSMKVRCLNVNRPAYKKYGGAGITFCLRWLSFENFLEDMGVRPGLEYSLDRYPDKLGNYEKNNCRWATKSQQARNRLSSRPVVRSDGISFPSIIDAAEGTPGTRRQAIRDCCLGLQINHGGFRWGYQ